MKKTIFNEKGLSFVVEDDKILSISGRFLFLEGHGFETNFFDFIQKELSSFNFEEINCTIEYIGAAASKELLSLLTQLNHEEINQTIHWNYEEDDEGIYALGEHYKHVLEGYSFELKEIK